jgi:hypothetical protein
MRASLNFTLPDDQAEFDAALSGAKALTVLFEIDRYCRNALKHGDPDDEARGLLFDIRLLIPENLLEL